MKRFTLTSLLAVLMLSLFASAAFAAVPDFQSAGFPDVVAEQTIDAGKAATLKYDHVRIVIPEGTFTNKVKFQVLEGSLNDFQAKAPEGETVLMNFAFKVTDLTTGERIGKFNKPVLFRYTSPAITSNSKYYNIQPDGTFVLNSVLPEIHGNTLTHPNPGAPVGWAVTSPTKNTETESFDGSIVNNSLAVSPDEQIAVVSDSRVQSIRIYDLAKGVLRKEIGGFVSPRNVVFVDGGSTFVVSDSTLGTLRFYNAKNLTLQDEVVVGPGAFGTAVSPDGRTLYVNNQAHSSVTIVDLEKRKPISVITGFAQPRQGIVVSPDGQSVFVTNFKGDKVSVVDAATKSIVREITGFSMIRGISVTENGILYAANSGRDSISVVDISQGKIIDEIKVGREPYGAALSPDGQLLFASSKTDNAIDVIDVSDNRVIDTIGGFLEPRQAIVFNHDGTDAYVLNRDLSISVVDVKSRTIATTIPADKK
ncbi:beta-propeller fold lactonase family protein [Paenibacillus spongiae]|uniref:Beta-propeller fold lactonase family protein n=1 Tax=Paenibacillus spongiae TaxID=2909671 RepID=A0ABY5S3M5_9BACL|nr:beta-propeller fold lactonase family protein [Paenibacillus spongiae]UVI28496.1 beta-propeller fold lactonase family protein [Paenibacillus spongiae]